MWGKKIVLVGILTVILASSTTAQDTLDTTKIGVSVGEAFEFTVHHNNMTRPTDGSHDPFSIERQNRNSPSYEAGDIFVMEIVEIDEPSEDPWGNPLVSYNASYTMDGEVLYESSQTHVIRRGLIIGNDWEYWNGEPEIEGHNGEILFSGIYNYERTDLGDTFLFNMSAYASSIFDPIDYLIEEVYYDKETGVVTEIKIEKTFDDGEVEIRHVTGVKLSNAGEEDSPGFGIALGFITISTLTFYRRRLWK